MPDNYDTLIAGQYAGDLLLLEQVGGQYYIGYDYKTTTTPTTWTLRLGRYPGNYEGTAVDLHGYWIYRKGVPQCWQAVNRGGGALAVWNQDGHAAGNPEDWELFTFQSVNKQQSTVKIYNSSYQRFQTIHTGHVPTNPPCYINLVRDTFSCNDSVTNAAIFIVQFPTGGNPGEGQVHPGVPHIPPGGQPPSIPGKPRRQQP